VIPFPIETERLVVRPLEERDAVELHELYSDAQAMQYLVDRVPSTLDESREWVRAKIDLHERDGLSLWAVVERDTESVVGDAGLQWEEIDGERELDLGVRVVRRCWGRGYATEVSRALIDAAFADVRVPRLTAQTDTRNAAARRVLESLGMRYEREIDWQGRAMALYLLDAPR
jgi:[ribosomal protein S5]-alanine N-acetyltransferase